MLYYFALKIVGMAMSVFGTNYTVFVVGRFCLGCGHVGYHHPGFVLGQIYTSHGTIKTIFFRTSLAATSLCLASYVGYKRDTARIC